MAREVVRNMTSEQTHLADVHKTIPAMFWGAKYEMPDPRTRALCGVRIGDGVVMEKGTKVKCGPCVFIDSRSKE